VLALLVLAWTLEFALIEGVLRLFGFGPPDRPQVQARFDKFEPDELLTWRLKPSWSGSEQNGAPVRTNTLGLRGPELAADSGERLLFLGDSVVFGHFLSEEETIPRRLETLLRRAGEPDVEVVNAGVPGYGTFQEELYYRERGRELRPTRVLLGFCLNDVTERYTSNAAWGGGRFFMGNVDTTVGMHPLERLWRSSAIRDAIGRLLQTSAKRGEAYRMTRIWTAPESAAIREAWDTVFGELDRLAAAVAADGIPFDVVLFPIASQLVEAGPSRLPQDGLLAHLAQLAPVDSEGEERGVRCLDLLEPLRVRAAENGGRERLFLDETHFTPLGARLAAAEIQRFLTSAEQGGR
jgi:lysophospholipase L1-like esterase